MGSKSYRDLVVWQKAMDLAVIAYRVTGDLPKEEMHGLIGQMRRAAVSVPSNIAEGEGRWSTKEFAHFLRIANGSTRELETQLLLCERLGYLAAQSVEEAIDTSTEVSKLLGGLLRSLAR